jgi:hypothetical protein
MIFLTSVWRELAGLFVDDGALALAIVAVVLPAGILATLMPDIAWAAGAILLFGCLGVLFSNAVRAGQR